MKKSLFASLCALTLACSVNATGKWMIGDTHYYHENGMTTYTYEDAKAECQLQHMRVMTAADVENIKDNEAFIAELGRDWLWHDNNITYAFWTSENNMHKGRTAMYGLCSWWGNCLDYQVEFRPVEKSMFKDRLNFRTVCVN